MYSIQDRLLLRSPTKDFGLLFRKSFEVPINDSQFLESIFLASRSLYQELEKGGRPTKQAHRSFLNYFLRSITRCTPFGFFAGVNTCEWGDKTRIEFSDYRLHPRLDFPSISRFGKIVTRNLSEVNACLWYTNSTLYYAMESLRFYELANNKESSFNLSQVEYSDLLALLLKKAKEGITTSQIAAILYQNGYSETDVGMIIESLFENSLLVSEFDPSISGEDALSSLICWLREKRSNTGVRELQAILEEIEFVLRKIKDKEMSLQCGEVEIKDQLSQIASDSEAFIQVDLVKGTRFNSIDYRFKKVIKKAIEGLSLFGTGHTSLDLKIFKERFVKRFGKQRIPLLIALDPEAGVGYGDFASDKETTLTSGLLYQNQRGITWKINKKDRILFHRLQKALALGAYSVDLGSDDLDLFHKEQAQLPYSFSIQFQIIDFESRRILVDFISGPTALPMLGRFSYADPQISELLLSVAGEEAERRSNVAFAEIVHLPDEELGNVLSHPSFWEYEIPCLTRAAVATERQILLQDLEVFVDGAEVKLASRKLGRQVIPRLSNAHSFRQSPLPVYRFLCDLQSEGIPEKLEFDWGALSKESVFLPRATYHDIILFPATWRLKREEWKSLIVVGSDRNQAIEQFLLEWRIPQYVVLVEYDRHLFVDFNNPVLVDNFFAAIKSRTEIVLKEFLFDPNTPIRDTGGGKYMNEFVSIVLNDKFEIPQEKESLPEILLSDQRTFLPGSEWIYYKIYCNPQNMDSILIELVSPLVEGLLVNRRIDQWHFLRYEDPNHHIRLRLHVSDISSVVKVLSLFERSFRIWESYITDVQIGSYERELERYIYITTAENFFWIDSEAALNFLKSPYGTDFDQRWLWSIFIIDSLLNKFGFSLKDKISLFGQLKGSYYTENSPTKSSRRAIDKRFRAYRLQVERSLSGQVRPEWQHIAEGLIQSMAPIVDSLAELKNKSIVLHEEVIVSYIHMHLNRVLPYDQRKNEMVIYDFMHRALVSKEARI